jgi:hypothetical protein
MARNAATTTPGLNTVRPDSRSASSARARAAASLAVPMKGDRSTRLTLSQAALPVVS